MATIVLCMLLMVFVSSASTSLCTIPEGVNSGKNYKYHYMAHNNSCFVFALTPASVNEALRNCRSLGGYLTDVELVANNNSLQNYIRQEMSRYPTMNRNYWIGLIHNDDLDEWYWANGAHLKKQEVNVEKGWWWWSEKRCVVLTLNTLKDGACADKEAYICKFELSWSQDVRNATDCSQRCVGFIKGQSSNVDSKKAPNTAHEGNDSSDKDESEENETTTPNDSRRPHTEDSNDRLHQCKMDTQSVIIIAVVGCVAALLIVALGAACSVIVKYRRLLRNMEESPRISLVDIMSADQFETFKKRPSEHSISNQGSAFEILYSNADEINSTQLSVYRHAINTSDILFHNNSTNGGVSVASPSESLSRAEYSDPRDDMGNNEYSCLNRNGEGLEDAHSQAVYGMESASDYRGTSAETSSNYESCIQ